MSAPPPSGGGGFSLFPNTSSNPRPPSRNQPTRPRAQTPQGRPSISGDSSSTPPRASHRRTPSVREGKQKETPISSSSSTNPWQSALDSARKLQQQQQQYPHQPIEPLPQPPTLDTAVSPADVVVETNYPTSVPPTDVPPRCDTALSKAETLVRSPSVKSRSSIAKPPIAYHPAGGSFVPAAPEPEPPIRSIFPRYNPEVPLEQQDYYPTQASPVHIPQSAISRPMYSPRNAEVRSPGANTTGSAAGARSPNFSPAPTANSTRWPGRSHEPSVVSPVCTTEELRGLWKAANGWKASSLEGRIYCLKMTADREAPIYTLSSAQSQPFYSLRVDPTSASALVTLSRYDPSKPFKGNTSSGGSGGGSPSPRASSSSKHEAANKHDAKHWQEVLGTTLEAASRKQPPNDGLVAQLWPTAAARLALDRANDAATVMMAEQECARLVWDADSGNHYLVHPALAMPFCVTVERHAAYSRVEYTLEHIESPVHLGRLTRDGTGAAWLEVDTSIASKVDAVYLVDVVVAALVLVAHADDQFTHVETFEPPPAIGDPSGGSSIFGGGRGSRASFTGSRRERRNSRSSRASGRRDSRREEKERQKELSNSHNKKSAKSRMEQFEIDLESQTSEFAKIDIKGDKEKLPGAARGIIALLTVTFKCFIWCATLLFKGLMALVAGLARCLGSDKL